ncbi:c2H2-type domain-containing protein [Trichonephila clavipes]|nr:c2H2-type domain-containing protein [Trichonephila clavipes]
MNSTNEYYVCEFCDKQFKRKGNSNNHSKTHIKDEAHTKVYDITSAETKDVKLPSRNQTTNIQSFKFATRLSLRRETCKDIQSFILNERTTTARYVKNPIIR